MTDKLKPGDKVQWKTSQGTTTGSVKKKLTSPIDIQGHHVAASPANPEYLVESAKSGKVAAHKPGALVKKSGGSQATRSGTAAKSGAKKGATK